MKKSRKIHLLSFADSSSSSLPRNLLRARTRRALPSDTARHWHGLRKRRPEARQERKRERKQKKQSSATVIKKKRCGAKRCSLSLPSSASIGFSQTARGSNMLVSSRPEEQKEQRNSKWPLPPFRARKKRRTTFAFFRLRRSFARSLHRLSSFNSLSLSSITPRPASTQGSAAARRQQRR